MRTSGQVFSIENGIVTDVKSYEELKNLWCFRFTKCFIESQIHGVNGSKTIGKILFEIWDGIDVEGKTRREMECAIRHAHSSDLDFSETELEVEQPIVLQGEIGYLDFRSAVSLYYRDIFGDSAMYANQVITFSAGSSVENTEVKNSTYKGDFYTYAPKINPPTNNAW
ncbi:MAG: hypothetical protein EOO38_12315 [Cytophagaceae bacterium]|nr:MAG: hypothetical protein EOO38_12315 [Cytophagaceae bacterium]